MFNDKQKLDVFMFNNIFGKSTDNTNGFLRKLKLEQIFIC